MLKTIKMTIPAIIVLGCVNVSALPAFPGAEGFGSQTTHGRGGKIIEVTNLNNDGAGSLRAAIATEGKRIIVFRVGGRINLTSTIVICYPNCMIAGQTAPGGGICICGAPINIATHDVVIRHLRLRPGDGAGDDPEDRDGMQVFPYDARSAGFPSDAYNNIIDHCSISWGIDENLSFYGSLDPSANVLVHDCTIQWSIVSEGLAGSLHPKGSHSKGILVGGGANKISVHHTLMAHNQERHPLFKTGTNGDVVNNVLYNVPQGIGLVNEDNDMNHPYPTALNIVGNTAIEGVNSTNKAYVIMLSGTYLTKPFSIYMSDNRCKYRTSDAQDQWLAGQWDNLGGVQYRSSVRVLSAPAITTHPAALAYDTVLDNAGAILPVRDAVDIRVVGEVRAKTGRIIDSPGDAGGYPSYPAGSAPMDGDHDGMPDVWEGANGLNSMDASDGIKDADTDGYTNVEEFLNGTNPKNGVTGLRLEKGIRGRDILLRKDRSGVMCDVRGCRVPNAGARLRHTATGLQLRLNQRGSTWLIVGITP